MYTFLEFLNEQVDPQASNSQAIQYVIDKERNVGFLCPTKDELKHIKSSGLSFIEIPVTHWKFPGQINYVIYNEVAKREAEEIANIARRHKGLLSHEASMQETDRIGQILGYSKKDIETHLQKYGDEFKRKFGY